MRSVARFDVVLKVERPSRSPAPAHMGSPPYPIPALGIPLRAAFVGQSTFFEACALGGEDPGIATVFVEFRAGGDPARVLRSLHRFDPHVVIVFRPEIIPPGLF